MAKSLDISALCVWSALVVFTLVIIIIPKLNIYKRVGFIASLYVIFGNTYYKSINIMLGCIILYFKPSNKLFCRISRVIFGNVTGNVGKLENVNSKIFICNYPELNLIEYFTQGLLPQNYILVVNKKFRGFVDKVYPMDRLILLDVDNPDSDNYSQLLELVKSKTSQGYNIFCYFDTRHPKYPAKKKGKYTLNGIRKGIFNIAKQLDIPVIPIVMDHLYISNGSIPRQQFKINVSDEVYIKDESDIERIIQYYKKSLSSLQLSKFSSL